MSRLIVLCISVGLFLGAAAFSEEADSLNNLENEQPDSQLFNLEEELAALEADLAKEVEEHVSSDVLLSPSPLMDLPEKKPQQEAILQLQIDNKAQIEVLPLIQVAPATVSELSHPKEEKREKIVAEAAKIISMAPLKVQAEKKKEELAAREEEVGSIEVEAAEVEQLPSLISFNIDFKEAFSGAPLIYSLLFAMSTGTVFICLYSFIRMHQAGSISPVLLKHLKGKLQNNQYEEAASLCSANNTLFCRMITAGIAARRHGFPNVVETMKAEGKRASMSFWQKLTLLNDVAIIAPMLGLLGTVLGMFYAFYDLNRSLENFTTLFDGLGISVGTTVAGLIVSIIAMILHSAARYRLMRTLARVENEAQTLAPLIDSHISALYDQR